MEFTKNELNLMRYAMEDLLINRHKDDVPPKFEEHVNEVIEKIDSMLG
jgi:hypothetical protein